MGASLQARVGNANLTIDHEGLRVANRAPRIDWSDLHKGYYIIAQDTLGTFYGEYLNRYDPGHNPSWENHWNRALFHSVEECLERIRRTADATNDNHDFDELDQESDS